MKKLYYSPMLNVNMASAIENKKTEWRKNAMKEKKTYGTPVFALIESFEGSVLTASYGWKDGDDVGGNDPYDHS